MSHAPYIRIDFHNIFHVGHCFVLKRAQVMWRLEERSIRTLNEDCQSSLKSGDTEHNLIFQRIIFKTI